jgi:hypothetical protein
MHNDADMEKKGNREIGILGILGLNFRDSGDVRPKPERAVKKASPS